jgi:hypothetical protein
MTPGKKQKPPLTRRRFVATIASMLAGSRLDDHATWSAEEPSVAARGFIFRKYTGELIFPQTKRLPLLGALSFCHLSAGL